MLSSLPDLQKEKGLPHPSRKKKTLKLKRESTSLTRGGLDTLSLVFIPARSDEH